MNGSRGEADERLSGDADDDLPAPWQPPQDEEPQQPHKPQQPRQDAFQPEEQSATGFAAAVMSVITGVARVESLSRNLVEGAVRQALLGVAQDVGTTVHELMVAHGDRAVADWTRADRLGAPRPRRRPRPAESPAEPQALCTAVTRSKKPCSKPARVGTLCSWHAAMAEAAAKARVQDENIDRVQQPREEQTQQTQQPREEQSQQPPDDRNQRVADFQESLREMPPPPVRMSQSLWTFSQQR